VVLIYLTNHLNRYIILVRWFAVLSHCGSATRSNVRQPGRPNRREVDSPHDHRSHRAPHHVRSRLPDPRQGALTQPRRRASLICGAFLFYIFNIKHKVFKDYSTCSSRCHLYLVTFPITVELIDGNNGKPVRVSAGTLTMVRIPNPLYKRKGDWLVIKDTKIGLALAFLWTMQEEEPRIRIDLTAVRHQPRK